MNKRNINIESNIPIPAYTMKSKVTNEWVPEYPFREMKVGESFIVDVDERTLRLKAAISNSLATIGEPDFEFVFLETRERKGYDCHIASKNVFTRVWRVK